jgi:hypothetical protein
VIILVVLISGGWCMYTLASYDTTFLPHYLIGLSDSNKYYIENISDRLMKSEKEFVVSDVDTSNWKNYESKKYGFSFKYPDDYEIKNLDEDLKYIPFIRKDKDDVGDYATGKNNECKVVISDGGWAINMLRARNWISKGDQWYIKKNNIAYPILNMRNKNIEEKINSENFDKSVELLFFKGGKYALVNFEENCGVDMFKGVLSTLKF